MSEYVITKLLYEYGLIEDNLKIIDCGARGASFEAWHSIADRLTIHGFDPDEDECLRLNKEAVANGLDYHYYPLLIAGKTESRNLYLTNEVSSCSLYEPDNILISRYRQRFATGEMICTLDTVGYRETKVDLQTRSLDEWALQEGLYDFDFIKLDVQGAELEVIKGASMILKYVVGINVEVWFTPLYKRQPLYAEIDTEVRSKNFDFFTFYIYDAGQFVGRMASPVSFTKIDTITDRKRVGQLVTADGLYLRDPIRNHPIPIKKLLKLICFAELCHQIEYSFELLKHLALLVAESQEVSATINQVIAQAAEYYQTSESTP